MTCDVVHYAILASDSAFLRCTNNLSTLCEIIAANGIHQIYTKYKKTTGNALSQCKLQQKPKVKQQNDLKF